MNETNLVKRLNWLATGDSFLKENPIPLDAMRVAASGIPIGAGTAPTSIQAGVSFDSTETALLYFTVPMDYDPTGNRLALRFKVTPSANNDTTLIGITTAQNLWRHGDAVDATVITASAESAQAAAVTSREAYAVLDGTYEPGDTIQVTVSVTCAGTDELVVHSVDLIYGSCLAAHDNEDRNRDIS